MTTRHFYPSAEGLVLKSLRGAILLNPSLKLHPASRTVYTTYRSESANVSVICGGGAGHEPAYAGYTGRGMLTACVSGEIFASPSSKQILNTIRIAAFGSEDSPLSSSEKRDVLVIINNYTGDRLNFGLAIEKARVLFSEINLTSVVVADDVSLIGTPADAVGPRGLAGNILVCKLLGALADKGANLEKMKTYGEAVVANLSSMGVALEHCHVPGREEVTKPLEEDECEIGLGLHNEAGVGRVKMADGIKGVIEEMVKMLLERTVEGKVTTVTRAGDETILFVNNLGGVSQLEMGALLSDLVNVLVARDVHPRRIFVSSFMTSLNASGFSATLLNVSEVNRHLRTQNVAVGTFELVDAPTDAYSWLGVQRYWEDKFSPTRQEDTHDYFPTGATINTNADVVQCVTPSNIANALHSACHAVLKVEKELTEYDTATGDGDCGHTFAAGAHAILGELEERDSVLIELDPAALTQRVAAILEDSMGGTIGALFGIYLNALAFVLHSTSSSPGTQEAPMRALEVLAHHTTAKPGDRTVIDALHPFCESLAKSGNLSEAVVQAISGAKATRDMTPKLGRAAYVGKTEATYNVLDPGAWGVAKLLEGFSEGWLRHGKRGSMLQHN
ncbi:Dihydroxyacetone kinase 1 [Leucoagaricus sp. SymC.cos]|nr:Dihydroxyacetone kinase 1 [Leucoagaricus sp. SymC.cos]